VSVGLDSALRFVAARFSRPESQCPRDEELGNAYTNINDDEDMAFQNMYDDHARQNFFRAAVSFLPGFLQKKRPAPEPASSASWFSSGREAELAKGGLLRSMTPSFLLDDEEDFASACCPSLGFKQRIFGCACCFLMGQVMQFFSFGAFTGVLMGHPGRFAFLYTLGNITMMGASFFLSGPQAQCRKLKAKDRMKTSMLYFCTMFLTVVVVFSSPFFGRALVILLCVAVQWLALVWYVLSFVPYGQTTAKRTLRAVCGCCLRM